MKNFLTNLGVVLLSVFFVAAVLIPMTAAFTFIAHLATGWAIDLPLVLAMFFIASLIVASIVVINAETSTWRDITFFIGSLFLFAVVPWSGEYFREFHSLYGTPFTSIIYTLSTWLVAFALGTILGEGFAQRWGGGTRRKRYEKECADLW